MQEITILGIQLQLLPDKAIFVEDRGILLVSDVHLGKSDTFQKMGVPVSNQVNQSTIARLYELCQRFQPKTVAILGDLFHSRAALTPAVTEQWQQFLTTVNAEVQLVVGNHDRALITGLGNLAMVHFEDAIHLDRLILSHEPAPKSKCLNICGHIHPCVRITTKLDSLRLPCFYLDKAKNQLILPSFGEFTGAYEMPLKPKTVAYVIVENSVISFEG
jgi:uncharacterized protein